MYKYLIFDGQYFLTRNYHALRSRSKQLIPVLNPDGGLTYDKNGDILYGDSTEFSHLELVKSFFWSICKLTRSFNCEKVILAFDKYPYHRMSIVQDYKGSRVYHTEDDLAQLNFEDDPLAYNAMRDEINCNKIKQHAKNFIIKYFGSFGMPCLVKPGYEADDWGYITAELLKSDSKKSALVSIDSDWSYLINPNIDHIKPNGKVITYDQMKKESEPYNLSLYEYKSYVDSLCGSHNDLVGTINPNYSGDRSFSVIYDLYKKGNTECFSDINLIENQLKSFRVTEFPDYQDALSDAMKIDKMGSLVSSEKFAEFNTGVTQDYYNRFVESLNKNLYQDE